MDYWNQFQQFRNWPVEDRKFHVQPKPLIDLETPLMAIGSCFAEYILECLERLGFNVFDPHWGYKYSTSSILREVKNAFQLHLTTDASLYLTNMGYTDLNHHRIYDTHKDKALWKINEIEARAQEMLPNTRILVMTLGQNEVWKNLNTNEYILHPYPGALDVEKDLQVHFISLEENEEQLEEIYTILTTHIPDIQIIITVSPIPLRLTYQDMDAVQGNNISKYTLYVAANEFASRHGNVHYFPGFDIVEYECKGKEYHLSDNRHLHHSAVNKVLMYFMDSFCTERTKRMVILAYNLNVASFREKIQILDELAGIGYPKDLVQIKKANAYVEEGMAKEALEALCEIGLADKSPVIQYNLALFSILLGDINKGTEYFEKALGLLEDIDRIAFKGIKREFKALYGSNHLAFARNAYEIRTIEMNLLKKAISDARSGTIIEMNALQFVEHIH